MGEQHRWVVVVTVAVPEPTPEQVSLGMVTSFDNPHSVAGPICFDCGTRAIPDRPTDCEAPRRPGYPTATG